MNSAQSVLTHLGLKGDDIVRNIYFKKLVVTGICDGASDLVDRVEIGPLSFIDTIAMRPVRNNTPTVVERTVQISLTVLP